AVGADEGLLVRPEDVCGGSRNIQRGSYCDNSPTRNGRRRTSGRTRRRTTSRGSVDRGPGTPGVQNPGPKRRERGQHTSNRQDEDHTARRVPLGVAAGHDSVWPSAPDLRFPGRRFSLVSVANSAILRALWLTAPAQER